MQSTIYFLQQQLKDAKETIANLQQQQQPKPTAVELPKESVEEKLEEDGKVKQLLQPELLIQLNPEPEREPEDAEENRESPEEQPKSLDDEASGAMDVEPEVDVAGKEEEEAEEEEEEVSLRSSRRGRATPTKSPAQSKRGRATRGQKRDVSCPSSSLKSSLQPPFKQIRSHLSFQIVT